MPPVIEAESFVVKDSRGEVRAHLGLVGDAGQEHYVGLTLYGEDGQSRVLISTAGAGTFDRSTVLLKDGRGAFRAKLHVVDQVATLVLNDDRETPRLRLACHPGGAAFVEVLAKDGSVVFSTRHQPET